MKFKDLLKDQGYLSVALPADDIEVQQILIKDGNKALKRLPDKLFTLFKQGEEAALPTTKQNARVPNFKGTAVTHFNTSLSLKFLEDLLKKIGVSLNFTLEISADEEMVFVFESPLKDEISSFTTLDRYLNDSQVIDGNFGKMLKDNDIYVITSVLKSNKFAFGVVKKSTFKSELELPSVKDFVEGEFTISSEGSKKRFFEYEGDQALIFAIQAVQVKYKRSLGQALLGQKGVFSAIDPVHGRIVRDDEDIKLNLLDGNDNEIIFEQS